MSSFEFFWDLVLWQLALQTRHRLFDSISNSEHFKCNMSVFDMFLLIQSAFFSSRITGWSLPSRIACAPKRLQLIVWLNQLLHQTCCLVHALASAYVWCSKTFPLSSAL
mmetsp:Transcript_99966/g.161153  ORF Transcript_99966/g.161153 Transcript_99966/m.161153 type:complete len:109 (-) Transcript_99966:394-720(-)